MIYNFYKCCTFIGTGKTRTLVGAVIEIVRQSNDSRVLICTDSKSACDELTERLLKILSNDEIFRLYAKSFNPDMIPQTIQPICNFRDGAFHYPCLDFLLNFRVLVCTLQMSGCLVRTRSKHSNFRPNHFTHVIIDEAAYCHETTALIAIAGKIGFTRSLVIFPQLIVILLMLYPNNVISEGLCTEVKELKSTIVLSGDPQQLEPVTKSEYAKQLGFKSSLMEFLMGKVYYQPTNDDKYDSIGIVQLTKNYRNHAKILDPSSKPFYKEKLEAVASKGRVTFYFINSK